MKRRDDPENFQPGRLSENGTIRKMAQLGEVIRQWGIYLVLAWFVGSATGWIPSPLTALSKQITEHDAVVQRVILERVARDREVAHALRQLAEQMTEIGRVNKLSVCAAVKDYDVRRECLR